MNNSTACVLKMADNKICNQQDEAGSVKLLISFRGSKVEIPLLSSLTVGQVKRTLAASASSDDRSSNNMSQMEARDVKLLYRGKMLTDNDSQLHAMLVSTAGNNTNNRKKTARVVKLVAMGVSTAEAEKANADLEEGILRSHALIRDDLTDAGRRREAARRLKGRALLTRAGARSTSTNNNNSGFGRIETLPMLPQRDTAKRMLTELSSDAGILACMAKHGWSVGCLAELYPEGKVGESAVCVMGLNQNKGQTILLRLRTDDLRGFRKMLSVRKVLFHELAHNVHSDHDNDFFRLMRRIERECNEMDWTRSNGSSTAVSTGSRYNSSSYDNNNDEADAAIMGQLFLGGSGRLGGSSSGSADNLSARELALRAAIQRMTTEEEEIQLNCGCGHAATTTSSNNNNNSVTTSEAVTTLRDVSIMDNNENTKKEEDEL